MWSEDLIQLLNLWHTICPATLIERIDPNGIIHTTNFRKISLKEFLNCPTDLRANFLKECLKN